MDLGKIAEQLFGEANEVMKKIELQYHVADESLPDFIAVAIQKNTLNGKINVGINTGVVHPMQ